MSLPSQSSTEKPTMKQNRRHIQVFDNTNIEEFFRQPSPEALSISSEMRVLQTIEDLKKQTSEEIENWSQGEEVIYAPLPTQNILNKDNSIGQDGLHQGDMVSSPVSLTSPMNLPLTESNIISVSRFYANTPDRAGQSTSHTKSSQQVEEGPGSCPTETQDTLSFPDKPTFQSFLKQVAKTPPLGVPATRDFACCDTKPLPALPIEPRPRTASYEEKPAPHPADDYEDDVCVRIERSATMSCPKFATDRNPYKRKDPAETQSITSEAEARIKVCRPRSNSLPTFLIKRKPLPKDSPFVGAIDEHPRKASLPTFDDIITEEQEGNWNSDETSGSELDKLEQLLPLPPILISTLSRGKSIGKKLKIKERIAQRI